MLALIQFELINLLVNKVAIRHTEFTKFWFFVTWLFKSNYASAHQISSKCDNLQLFTSNFTLIGHPGAEL